ncbi:class I SAM-dependent methyltransferase [Thaumasiovibrio subtropicus]|uniref:class I SAM-dependent methyltransferase n=1 Tax=Thaumasiovibrio subtropicus TaxID=1891207 RepID=UPI000B350C19|nr:class I SAM-dependent methyltransferase [Thaumasiovibrio subtropicus]
MSDNYNDEVSQHYAAYRPPVHDALLEQILANKTYSTALDIGCGTGVSTRALLPYCDEIVGIDPSEAMLAKAIESPKIRYRQGTGECLPINDKRVDLVSFAGSLYYAKSATLIKELKRVCKTDARILVYDFEVMLAPMMALLDAETRTSGSSYNHAENLSDVESLKTLHVQQGELTFSITPQQLAHVLFSSERRYHALQTRYGNEETFNTVVKALTRHSSKFEMTVNIYHSLYAL